MSKIKWKLAKDKTWRMKLEQEHPSHGKTVPIPPPTEIAPEGHGEEKMLIRE